jgi:hypothetical protein
MTIDELWMPLSHRGVGLMPYGPEAEAQALQPLRAGGFALLFYKLNRQNSLFDVRCSTFTSFFSDQTGRFFARRLG